VICFPSGYCTPANAQAVPLALREGYRAYDIESKEALDAVARAVAAGASYRP
jgi:hypothetical protein